MKQVLILGAGGHAKVVVATARAAGIDVLGILDDDERKIGQSVFGVPVLGSLADLSQYRQVPCIVAVGDNASRRRLFEEWQWRQMDWGTLIHPASFVDDSATVGKGSVVFAGATVQVDVHIGAHCIINTQASVDHDCRLGDFVHLAPGCHLAGNVTVEDGAFLGIGSSVIPGVTIGADAVIGAGAVVISDVPAGVTVVGVPARAIRHREGAELH